MARIKLDFTGVEAFNLPEVGVHIAKIVSAEETTTQGGGDAIKVNFEVTSKQCRGARIANTFSLTEKALWKLKTLLIALGMKCDGRITLDLDKLAGRICMITVIEDEYDGKMRKAISSFDRYRTELKPQNDEEVDDDDDTEPVEDEQDEDEEEPTKPSEKRRAGRPRKDEKKAPAKVEDIGDEVDDVENPFTPVDDDDDYDDGEDW